jgi:hypothetical protein
VPITTKVISLNPAHGKVYLMQHMLNIIQTYKAHLTLLEQELLSLPRAPELTNGFSGVTVTAHSLVFCVVFCRSSFVCFFFSHCIVCLTLINYSRTLQLHVYSPNLKYNLTLELLTLISVVISEDPAPSSNVWLKVSGTWNHKVYCKPVCLWEINKTCLHKLNQSEKEAINRPFAHLRLLKFYIFTCFIGVTSL